MKLKNLIPICRQRLSSGTLIASGFMAIHLAAGMEDDAAKFAIFLVGTLFAFEAFEIEEARVRTDEARKWANRIVQMIATDHETQITVTHVIDDRAKDEVR